MIKKKLIGTCYIKILEKVKSGAVLSSTTFLKSSFKSGAGFTLIELIVVISVAAAISVVGIAAFVSYNQSQALDTAAADIISMFNLAKSRAASQVKPADCSGQTLDGYEIRLCGLTVPEVCKNPDGASYELDVRCNGEVVETPILTGKLPSNVIFDSSLTTSTTYTYSVLTGGFSQTGSSSPPPWTIALTGYNMHKSITVDSLGNAK